MLKSDLRLTLVIYLFHKGYLGHQLLWRIQLETPGTMTGTDVLLAHRQLLMKTTCHM